MPLFPYALKQINTVLNESTNDFNSSYTSINQAKCTICLFLLILHLEGQSWKAISLGRKTNDISVIDVQVISVRVVLNFMECIQGVN